MTTQRIDVKQLLFLIDDQKDIPANLILDDGCILWTDDPNPLIKVINYFYNYLNQLTEQPLEIALDLSGQSFTLRFLAYTTRDTLPLISDHLGEALAAYQARHDVDFNPGRLVQINIHFTRQDGN